MISLFRRRKLPELRGLALAHSVRLQQQELVGVVTKDLAKRFNDLRDNWPASSLLNPSGSERIHAAAVVCEAAKRALGIQLFDVQILAGLTLSQGRIAEMATGEGKTLTAALPAAIYSLFGLGVHVSTSNGYLAERDCQQLRPLFETLGLTVGCLTDDQCTPEKQVAYRCDITYGPGYEFGFDYLRDQVQLRQGVHRRLGQTFLDVMRNHQAVDFRSIQRPLAIAIVDEIDNVLIDDAVSPLLLSDTPSGIATDAQAHLAAHQVANQLQPRIDFEVTASTGSIQLTPIGLERIWTNSDAIPLKCVLRPWQNYIEQALRARVLFQRDVDYVIQKDKIAIVDSTTGRIFSERIWRDGLHQAVEAKEQLPITAEMKGAARITRQRFFQLYRRLCGMTGTAIGSEQEFCELYGLNVTAIPPRLPNLRVQLPSRFFSHQEAKWSAIASEVQQLHRRHQPVLIGTRSIAKSEQMAHSLKRLGLPFELLNGKQDADEAAIVSNAGRHGAITIATNMAGRGTDIRPDDVALKAGGLCVIATEHHDVQRIDRQLIGRSARQGERGCARLFVSADDDLLSTYGELLQNQLKASASRSGELFGDWSSRVRRIQAIAEREGYLLRRRLFQDDQKRDMLLNRLSGQSLE